MNTRTSIQVHASLPLTVCVALALGASARATPQTATTATPAAKPAAGGYHVLRTFDVGGEGGWDYLAIDSDSHRLFVTRSTHVIVLDTESGKQVGEIADTAGVHGVALAPDLGRGFTSNGKAGTCTIFDLKTLATIATVKTGENPDAILYDAHEKRVFTFNGRSADATAIDAATGTVVGTVALGGKPEFARDDGAGRIFVNIEDKSEVAVFDAKKLEVTARWPLAPGEEPSGMAIDLEHHRLFIGCGNEKLVILDTGDGKVLATLPIGKRVDANAFDPQTQDAFSSNGDSTLTVVHEDDPKTFRVVENAATRPGARTMALDPKTHVIYMPSAKFEAAEAGAAESHARPKMIPGTFAIVVLGR